MAKEQKKLVFRKYTDVKLEETHEIQLDRDELLLMMEHFGVKLPPNVEVLVEFGRAAADDGVVEISEEWPVRLRWSASSNETKETKL